MVGTRDELKSENQGCNKGSVGQGESLEVEILHEPEQRETVDV